MFLGRIARTECTDAAYCYRCFVVCVCLLHIAMICAETDELIEVPLRLRTRVDKTNHVLGEGPDPPRRKVIFEEWGRRPLRCGLTSGFLDHLLLTDDEGMVGGEASSSGDKEDRCQGRREVQPRNDRGMSCYGLDIRALCTSTRPLTRTL